MIFHTFSCILQKKHDMCMASHQNNKLHVKNHMSHVRDSIIVYLRTSRAYFHSYHKALTLSPKEILYTNPSQPPSSLIPLLSNYPHLHCPSITIGDHEKVYKMQCNTNSPNQMSGRQTPLLFVSVIVIPRGGCRNAAIQLIKMLPPQTTSSLVLTAITRM